MNLSNRFGSNSKTAIPNDSSSDENRSSSAVTAATSVVMPPCSSNVLGAKRSVLFFEDNSLYAAFYLWRIIP
ncbi:hypothetical protein ARALYDRAFT_921127 [Arabidopsis lyrata subsp. lyrata]|uniref:Uncharacterized protein n=1 Tax=Arabidopsis lyrata subsp. lyrata TaxID=81972 RepID=D7MWD1_ARALL|nr:hypothetical protein ARALYDRAFT_921127 [Arabidopsis lyrata subsp. lyrata]